VDGGNLLGPVVGNFCMSLAIKKAKDAGIGWVVAKRTNHFGIAGHYSLQASKQGLIGMSFTNTSPFMVPTRAKKAALGTNPISVAASGVNNDAFVLDMATTAVAVGKLEIAHRKSQPIPQGWALDRDGKNSVNYLDVSNGGGLYPLGGPEETSGYKGYGLGFMVELFCGILAGSAFGPNVRLWMQSEEEANLGQCFVAIDPEAFAPGFAERLQSLMDDCRALEQPDNQSEPVVVAGDPEKAHQQLCDRIGGIPYHMAQISHAISIATANGVEPLVTKCV